MSTQVINTCIKHKRDTESNWQSKNPILLNGEIILVDMNNGELRAKDQYAEITGRQYA